MVSNTKLVENDTLDAAQTRFEQVLSRLEGACVALQQKNETLSKAQDRASEELGLHIRNLGRILERQESS